VETFQWFAKAFTGKISVCTELYQGVNAILDPIRKQMLLELEKI
jgi:hypothetical protein